MKFLKKGLLVLLGIIVLLSVLLFATGNEYLFKGVYVTYLHGENSATITDKSYFDTRTIASGEVIPWENDINYNKLPLSDRLENTLEENESISFLALKDGKIIQEHYWGDGAKNSKTNSFSMAKSIVSILIGIAIEEGHIEGVFQPVVDFFPEWDKKNTDNYQLEIIHLLTMSSELDWDESYKSPFSITAKAYYGDDIESLMLSLNIKDKPGSEFKYLSGNTQLLGLILARATGKTLSEYASEKLWKPLGAEEDALWHLDKENDGKELAYCCFNSSARDFARIGQLYLNKGQWHGKQIVNKEYTEISTRPSSLASHYGYSWWIATCLGEDVFYARGILGQYIIVVPERNIVIVRLGHKRGQAVDMHRDDFYTYVEEIITMYPN